MKHLILLFLITLSFSANSQSFGTYRDYYSDIYFVYYKGYVDTVKAESNLRFSPGYEGELICRISRLGTGRATKSVALEIDSVSASTWYGHDRSGSDTKYVIKEEGDYMTVEHYKGTVSKFLIRKKEVYHLDKNGYRKEE